MSVDSPLLKEWNYDRNGMLTPSDFKEHSARKIWWKCKKGHEWKTSISNRSRGDGCPECNSGIRTSFPEQAIYFYVKKIYPDAVNRCTDVLPNGMEIDIFIPSINVGIEYDGSVWHESDKVLEKEVKNILNVKGMIFF